jgi:hypothetical protein
VKAAELSNLRRPPLEIVCSLSLPVMVLNSNALSEAQRVAGELEGRPPRSAALSLLFPDFSDDARKFSPESCDAAVHKTELFLRAFHAQGLGEKGATPKLVPKFRAQLQRDGVVGKIKAQHFFQKLNTPGVTQVVDIAAVEVKRGGGKDKKQEEQQQQQQQGDEPSRKRSADDSASASSAASSASAASQPPNKRHRKVSEREKTPQEMTITAVRKELVEHGLRAPNEISWVLTPEADPMDGADWNANWKARQKIQRKYINEDTIRQLTVLRAHPEPPREQTVFGGKVFSGASYFLTENWKNRLVHHGATFLPNINDPNSRQQVTHLLCVAPITDRARDQWKGHLMTRVPKQQAQKRSFLPYDQLSTNFQMVVAECLPVVMCDGSMPTAFELGKAIARAEERVSGHPRMPAEAFTADPTLVEKRFRELLPPACIGEGSLSGAKDTGFVKYSGDDDDHDDDD